MAIRTEMISIAMPQPVEAKFPGIHFIPHSTESFQWGPGRDRSGSLAQRNRLIVVTFVLTKGIEAICQEWDMPKVIMGHSLVGLRGGIGQIEKEGMSSIDHQSRSPSLWLERAV